MNEQEIIQLITKVLASEASSDEQKQLEQWRNMHPDNELQFKETQLIWDNASLLQEDSVDTDAAWEKLSARMHAPKKIINLNYYLRIAAAGVLIGGGSLFFGSRWFNGSMQTIRTASSEIKEITLPDGSVAWLNHDSQLEYEKNFKGDMRSVKLNGEAFFSVVKNPEKPFVITSAHAVTTVLGTSFNLSDHDTAADATLTVATGKVSFVSPETKSEVIVLANESASITSGEAVKHEIPDMNGMGWKTKKLVFKDAPLSEVFKTLEHYYNITIVFKNRDANSCHFTAEFEDPRLKYVMDVLCKTLELTWEQKGNTVTVSGKGCN